MVGPSAGVRVTGSVVSGADVVLTDEALHFVADLHRRFNAQRLS